MGATEGLAEKPYNMNCALERTLASQPVLMNVQLINGLKFLYFKYSMYIST